ncbi:MAG: hypothetical protein OEW08_03365, partial [Gammaproteobacteria bacterium]|nr:hypothetical protein [Gammaproteobacteria bacterium]
SLLPAASRVQKISIAAAKIPQIIFSQTPEDTEPTEANDRYIWRSMIIRKKLLFTGKSHLTHFDLPKINVYVANGIDGPFAMLALKEGGAYVEIQGRKFPFEAFERVITSVEVN